MGNVGRPRRELSDDEIKTIYKMRKEGHLENHISNTLFGNPTRHERLRQADAEEHTSRDDYVPPNKHGDLRAKLVARLGAKKREAEQQRRDDFERKHAEKQKKREEYRNSVAALTADKRKKVIDLHINGGMSVRQTSKHTGIPVGTVARYAMEHRRDNGLPRGPTNKAEVDRVKRLGPRSSVTKRDYHTSNYSSSISDLMNMIRIRKENVEQTGGITKDMKITNEGLINSLMTRLRSMKADEPTSVGGKTRARKPPLQKDMYRPPVADNSSSDYSPEELRHAEILRRGGAANAHEAPPQASENLHAITSAFHAALKDHMEKYGEGNTMTPRAKWNVNKLMKHVENAARDASIEGKVQKGSRTLTRADTGPAMLSTPVAAPRVKPMAARGSVTSVGGGGGKPWTNRR